MNIHVIRYDSLGSTNTEAMNQAKLGASEGLCIVADRQLDGRGREGRKWNSANGGGLYFSIVLRPTIEPRFLPILTLLAAVAVHDTLSALYDVEADIKWPNDILIDGKKICGILAETVDSPQGAAVVVGIGLNCNSDDLTGEVKSIATSILDETGKEPDRSHLIQTLTHFLSAHYDQLTFLGHTSEVIGNWAARSTFFRGKNVVVKTRVDIFEGTTVGLDQTGALLVETANGGIMAVTAGDVEALRPQPSNEEPETRPDDTDESADKDVKSDEICENGE
jgi:BirA family biotin operon repressor/biotin-[acetyl-CoA-carboxylase] ligase